MLEEEQEMKPESIWLWREMRLDSVNNCQYLKVLYQRK